MRRLMLGLLSAAVFAGPVASAFADVYTDGHLTVDWTRAADAYTGKLTLGTQEFPTVAHANGGTIDGTFQSNGTSFTYTAMLTGDTLTLTTGGKTYALKAQTTNPLDAAASANKAPAAGGGSGVPSGYTVMTHTDAGQAWSSTKANVRTVQNALLATLTDLSTYFDAKPKVSGAYENRQSQQAGGAMFDATLKGTPVHGMLTTKLDNNGASVAVVYCRADASADEWKKLNTPPPSPQDAAEAAVKLTDYSFPDGTGTIGLAEGWTTQAQTDLDRIFIQGPAGQHVAIGGSFQVVTPDSPMVQMQKQSEQRARQLGMAPPMAMPMLVGAFSAPADALKELMPQISAMAQRNSGFTLRLDQIISDRPIQARSPNGKASILEYLITKNDRGNVVQTHNIARMESSQFGPQMWSIYMIELTAPVDTYDRDKTVMMAMLDSLKENTEVCQRIMAQKQAASQQQLTQQGQDFQQQQQQRVADQQKAHQDQLAGYAAHNSQWARDENSKARSADNFTEMVGGYRTVIDTQTGQKSSVDYYNVDGIVNGLNTAANDPNRYVQIPLRDEKDPLPGQ